MGEPIVWLAHFLLFVHFFGGFLFHYLPIQEALTHVFQFDGETYDLSLVSLEWFKVVVVDYLFFGSGNASILGEFQLYYIYIMYGSVDMVSLVLRIAKVGKTISFRACLTSWLGMPRR